MQTAAARRGLPLLAFLGALAWAHAAHGEGSSSRVTVLFTGDNGGELAPCG